LAIGCGQNDEAVKLFDRPAVGDEASCQPVEQFRVSGRVAAHAEIAGSADQPLAKVADPDAVDQYSGRERVVRARDGLGQFQPAAAAAKRFAFGAAERFQELSRHAFAWDARVAANEDARFHRLRQIVEHHGSGRRTGVQQQMPVDFLLNRPQLLTKLAIVCLEFGVVVFFELRFFVLEPLQLFLKSIKFRVRVGFS
jgi:hypothetical protein